MNNLITARWTRRALPAVFLACCTCLGQEAVVLDIQVRGRTSYYYQDYDVNKWGSNAGPVTAGPMRAFCDYVFLGDITAVNGRPAKGTYVLSGRLLNLMPDAPPGQSIADITRGAIAQGSFEILDADGRQVGTLLLVSLAGGSMPPGGPVGGSAGNIAIVGGTGAYVGARGTVAQKPGGGARTTTVQEDPANRRRHADQSTVSSFLVQLIPMQRPEILQLSTGVAVYHATDMSPVSATAPARSGEWLVAAVSGLGPTQPGVDLGTAFPAWEPGKENVVNSPVEVVVGGKAAELRNCIGWPGQRNVYRVDFRVPDATAQGTLPVSVSAAWVSGSAVDLHVR